MKRGVVVERRRAGERKADVRRPAASSTSRSEHLEVVGHEADRAGHDPVRRHAWANWSTTSSMSGPTHGSACARRSATRPASAGRRPPSPPAPPTLRAARGRGRLRRGHALGHRVGGGDHRGMVAGRRPSAAAVPKGVVDAVLRRAGLGTLTSSYQGGSWEKGGTGRGASEAPRRRGPGTCCGPAAEAARGEE